MASRNTEIWVGITVLLALGLVIWSVTFLREVRLARTTQHWLARFPEVGGLATDDPISVNGVKKGAVKEIRLARGEVVVDFLLERDITLTSESRVHVRNVGLMGEKFIAIDLGAGGRPLVPARDTVRGVYESGIPEVVSQMAVALRSLDQLSTSVDRVIILAEENNTLRHSLANFEAASRELRASIASTRGDFQAGARDFAAAAEAGRRIAESNEERVARTLDDVSASSKKLDAALERADSLAAVLERVARKIDSGQSTAAKLVNERQLYDDLRASAREFQALARDIRTNPKKYFNVSVF
jgi:phospholipid/cholesterol/gamma-HCH transport system substrate-binding protein